MSRCRRGRWRLWTRLLAVSTCGLCIPAAGAVVDLKNFRRSQWKPALDAAGIPPRRIYDLRRSFATWPLDAGLSFFDLSRYIGTCVEMIDMTYGHLAQGAEETTRAKLNAAYLRLLGHERGMARSGEDG